MSGSLHLDASSVTLPSASDIVLTLATKEVWTFSSKASGVMPRLLQALLMHGSTQN